MIIRAIRNEEKEIFNQVVDHPLQSWEWGEFRKKTGLEVERVGFFDQGQLVKAFSVTFHKIPLIGKTAGYLPKAYMPDEEQIAALQQVGKTHNALFVKIEPNVSQKQGNISAHNQVKEFLLGHGAKEGRPLFTKYSFILDLQKSEEELFANLTNKTRYNVNLAYKKGVKIFENSSAEGLEQHLKVLSETTKRQGFYAHNSDYFRKMWESLSGANMMKIFHAVYEDQILVSWIMFVFNGKLYYPYGASSRAHREVMASNLMMWEMIRYGHSQNLSSFDMWGSLGPEPDPKNPWFGFHRFKKGYGGDLHEFIGTFDVVLDQNMYQLFKVAENWRWKVLRLRAKLPF